MVSSCTSSSIARSRFCERLVSSRQSRLVLLVLVGPRDSNESREFGDLWIPKTAFEGPAAPIVAQRRRERVWACRARGCPGTERAFTFGPVRGIRHTSAGGTADCAVVVSGSGGARVTVVTIRQPEGVPTRNPIGPASGLALWAAR